MTGSRALRGLIRPAEHAGPAAALAALMVASALTEGLGMILMIPMLTVLGQGLQSGGRIAEIVAALGIPLALGPLLILFVSLVVLRALTKYFHSLVALRFQMALVDGLRARAWKALLHADWRLLVTMQQADNTSLLISNIDRIGFGASQIIGALAATTTLAGIGAAALAISPLVSVAAIIGGILVLLAYRRMRRRATEVGEHLSRAYRQVHGRLAESVGALRVIKSFGREAQAEQDGIGGFADLRLAQLAYTRDMGLSQIALQCGGALVLAVLVWLGVMHWHAGLMTMLPLVALFARGLPLIGQLQECWQNWAHSIPALDAAMDLIAQAEAAREPDPGDADPPQLEDAIELAGVTVQFPDRLHPALSEISLTIEANRTTALVGASGAGKSTLADLLGGLIAADRGKIMIDRMPLDDSIRRCWRSRVAYVQQEPVLFTATIRENLLWASPDATAERLSAVLRAASAGFVDELPHGIDTRVGDGGRQLSGGERQRIVLARALLRDPSLLILDEATSALDPENERAISEALGRLHHRLTIIIIGHRGALAALADRQVTLDNGKITKIVDVGK